MLGTQFFTNVTNTTIITLLAVVLVGGIQPAEAQNYTVLHTFTAAPDGALPNPLIRDAEGNLYGTTKDGGLVDCGEGTCGTVFKIDSAGNYSIIFNFSGGAAGTNPDAGLIRDAEGNLYGTTQGNGYIDGNSVIFKIDPKGRETVFNSPKIGSLDSPLVMDEQGNLYGMDPYWTEPNCGWSYFGLGCGALFKLSRDGKITVLHIFDGTDGMQPEGGLVRDAKGNLYGTTSYGGIASCISAGNGYFEPGCGTIFKLDTNGKFTVLHTFTGEPDGSFPLGLIIDSEGNLYGIAQNGGEVVGEYIYGLGTVFKVDASGNFSVLFTFTPQTTLNTYYASHLLRDSKGNLYGLEQFNNCALAGGCLFRIDPKGNYTDLYDFTGYGENQNGNQPMGIVFGSDGDIYGSMFVGGDNTDPFGPCGLTGCGTVFHLSR